MGLAKELLGIINSSGTSSVKSTQSLYEVMAEITLNDLEDYFRDMFEDASEVTATVDREDNNSVLVDLVFEGKPSIGFYFTLSEEDEETVPIVIAFADAMSFDDAVFTDLPESFITPQTTLQIQSVDDLEAEFFTEAVDHFHNGTPLEESYSLEKELLGDEYEMADFEISDKEPISLVKDSDDDESDDEDSEDDYGSDEEGEEGDEDEDDDYEDEEDDEEDDGDEEDEDDYEEDDEEDYEDVGESFTRKDLLGLLEMCGGSHESPMTDNTDDEEEVEDEEDYMEENLTLSDPVQDDTKQDNPDIQDNPEIVENKDTSSTQE